MAGQLVGRWQIDSVNSTPTGITIDPNDVQHIWIVDAGSDRIYQYDDGAALNSGARNASSSFALAAGNGDPQGLADPRVARPSASLIGSRRDEFAVSDTTPWWCNPPNPLGAVFDEAIEQLTEEITRLDLPDLIDALGVGGVNAGRLSPRTASYSLFEESRFLKVQAVINDLFADTEVPDGLL